MIKHYNIRIFGRVQGVNFRYLGKKEADKLGITGLIRNEPDGSVYIEAEGDKTALKEFLDWCKSGPPLARVSGIDVTEAPVKDYKGFEIKHADFKNL